MKTYSLSEVADIALPSDMKDPERWLRERLNKGILRGFRAGRTWRMTHRQLISNFEDRLSNECKQPVPASEPVEPVSILAGMSEVARKRIERQQDSRRLA